MQKIRIIIVYISIIIYITLLIMKVHITSFVQILLGGIILMNKAIEEWISYKKTKNKFHLLIPISAVILIIFVIYKIYG